jgi:small subunit ribosomal protein S2
MSTQKVIYQTFSLHMIWGFVTYLSLFLYPLTGTKAKKIYYTRRGTAFWCPFFRIKMPAESGGGKTRNGGLCIMMTESITMKQLLEAGVHFGHQSRRWNPKMAKYIFTERNGIYIIDLKKTLRLLREALKFTRESVAQGKKVLFVGTKKQARESVENAARECGMYYVNNRWLGGMLTNFKTIRRSINRLLELEAMWEDGTINRYTKKEISRLDREKTYLSKNLSGVKNMNALPGILFIVDPHKENLAVAEAKKLGIPIVAIVDTNCDPDPIDYVIPANDDAIRAIKLMADQVKQSCIEGAMELQAVEGIQPEGLTPEVASALGVPGPKPPDVSEKPADVEKEPEKEASEPAPESASETVEESPVPTSIEEEETQDSTLS